MKLSDYITEKPVLTTARLVLRPLTRNDIEDLRLWTPDPSLYAYWGKKPGKADIRPELLFTHDEKPAKSFHWGLEARAEGRVVGDAWVYLIENNRMAKVALRVAASHHGQGLGSEALREMVRFCFEQTELQRLWTDVDIRNAPSVRMLEKCGFTREGLIRQGKMVSSWCDYYLYGLLKSDRA